jgi:hypothetical protein
VPTASGGVEEGILATNAEILSNIFQVGHAHPRLTSSGRVLAQTRETCCHRNRIEILPRSPIMGCTGWREILYPAPKRQARPVQPAKNADPKYVCLTQISVASDFDKCGGGVPCDPCQKAKTQCEINTDNDGRRKVTLKRKIEPLEQDRDLLLQLVECIRNDDAETAPGVLNLIRSNAPLTKIRQYMAQSPVFGNCDEPQTKDPKSRSKFMDVNRLSDTLVFKVPAHPWTSITDDDDFVSHLISLYFTWQNCISNWFDRDLFLRDMRSKDLSSHFCSPLLVNSMLAVACVSFYFGFSESISAEVR